MSDANQKQVGGSHYKGGIDHWDYVVANDIPYLEAQIIKYVTRHRKKNGMQDLQKAQHFLEKLIEVEKMRAARQKLIVTQVDDHREPSQERCCGTCARWGTAGTGAAPTLSVTGRQWCPEHFCFTKDTEMGGCDRYESR